MRLLKTQLSYQEFAQHKDNLIPRIQFLLRPGSIMPALTEIQKKEIQKNGIRWLIDHGYGTTEDLKHTENPIPSTLAQVNHHIEMAYNTEQQVVIVIRPQSNPDSRDDFGVIQRQFITHQIRLGFEDIFGTAKGRIEVISDSPDNENVVTLHPLTTIL